VSGELCGVGAKIKAQSVKRRVWQGGHVFLLPQRNVTAVGCFVTVCSKYHLTKED